MHLNLPAVGPYLQLYLFLEIWVLNPSLTFEKWYNRINAMKSAVKSAQKPMSTASCNQIGFHSILGA